MGVLTLDGRHEQSQESEGYEGQVVNITNSWNEIRNQING